MEIEKKEEEINRVGSEMLVRQNDELVREKVELKKKIEKMRIEKVINNSYTKNLPTSIQNNFLPLSINLFLFFFFLLFLIKIKKENSIYMIP